MNDGGPDLIPLSIRISISLHFNAESIEKDKKI